MVADRPISFKKKPKANIELLYIRMQYAHATTDTGKRIMTHSFYMIY